MKPKYGWLLALVIAALLVVACGPAMETTAPSEATLAPTAEEETLSAEGSEPVDTDDWRAQGAADAPVTIVEYSDFQCPYCARYFTETYPQIKEQYVDTGQVRYLFRHFPLQFHSEAVPAAQAAECAGEQGKFWEMHDTLFEKQEEWAGSADAEAVFVDLAKGLDLDGAEFEACLSSEKYAAKVQADLQKGATEGITGTPGFFVNGVLLSGAQPLTAFQEQIDYFLAGGQPPTLEIAADSYRSMGQADAPVVITMFSDYLCPACTAVETQVMPEVIERYVETGQARLVFREFPIPSLHANAEKAAEAAVCAGEQDKYWEMHDKLYATNDAWAADADPSASLKELAGEIGLDEGAFAQCLDSGDAATVVQAEMLAGEMMGVNATPYFFVGDLEIRGGLPADSFGQIIEYVAAGGETPQILPIGDAPTVMGDRGTAAAVTVAFVDYGNTESAQHALEVLPKLRDTYIDTGEMLYVLHPWYSQAGSPAAQAAIAADCAGQQGSYWQMHDRLFEDQAEWLTADDPASLMKGYASALNLDEGAFETCQGSDETALHVMSGNVVAALYGVPGAPVFLFNNGQGQQGSPSFEEFQSIIDSILAPQG